MVAHALDNGDRTGVTHAEALTYTTIDIDLTAGRTVEQRITCDRVLLGDEGRAYRRHQADASTTQALA